MEFDELIKIIKFRYDKPNGQVFFTVEHQSFLLLFYRKDFLTLMKSSEIKNTLIKQVDRKLLDNYIVAVSNRVDINTTDIGIWLNKIGESFGNIHLPNISKHGRFNLTAYGTKINPNFAEYNK